MGHAYLKHINQAILRQLTYQIVLSTLIGDFSSLATNIIALQFSQKQELEADDFAVTMMNQQRISPEGLADVFQKFHELEDHSELGDYFSTHPASLKRVENVKNQIKSNIQYQPSLSKSDWTALKNICSKTISYKEYKDKD